MAEIHRICVVAKPARTHREFKQFETANIAILVSADGQDEAHARARKWLKKEHWELLQITQDSLLLEAEVLTKSDQFREFYAEAVDKGVTARVFPKNFASGKDGIPAIRPPRVTEEFMDRVVLDVGGERLDTDNKNRIADYRIGEWLFEMKDLQEEGLMKPERQEKLATIFTPYVTVGRPFQIDPEILTDEERRKYYDILSGPIQTQVKSASKQVRSTKELLGQTDLKGGIIFLNTGYGSYPQDEFGPMVERFVKKDTTQIEAIFCVSTWAVTNGFDSYMFFKAHPEKPKIPVVAELQKAFGRRFEEAMTQLVRDELPKAQQRADPLTPVAFSVNGLDFSWLPPEVPDTWKKS